MPAALHFDFVIWSQEAGRIPVGPITISFDESLYQRIEIATAITDSQLAFGGITTVDALVLKSSQAITLNINSDSGTDITIDADKPIILTGTSITALYVSNSSGATAVIEYWIWGT